MPAPRASRWMFRLSPVFHANPPIFNGWLDLVAISDTVLEGQSGPDPDEGWDINLSIENYIFPAVDPDFGKSGIRMRWTITHPGEPDWSYRIMFDKDAAEWVNGIPFDIFQVFVDPIALFTDDHDPILNPSWATVPSSNIGFLAMSECWLFPPLVAPAGFAAFNGTDTSILFDQFTNDTDARYQLEFDARFRDFSTNALLARTDNTVAWVNINRGGVAWKQFNIAFSPFLVNNVWYRIRLEYNWNDPGTGRKLYLDGVLNAHLPASGNVDLHFNLMGKKGPTYIGDFDCKNLTLLDTDPAAPRVLLDMPLIADACDVGELSIKGTTENMLLPSCP